MQVKLNKKLLIIFFFLSTAFCNLMILSCSDDYIYDDKEPGFLGASIYEYMEQDGNFTYFLRLIDDLGYKEVLLKTGSKTLFPARDEAFERFFRNNPYGVSSYDGLTPAQKRSLMNVSMVNMAYLSDMLSNVSTENGIGEGLALRHNTANAYLDSISFINDNALFQHPYWSRFTGQGVYLLDNENPAPIVHFTPLFMSSQGITNKDFSILYNGKEYDGHSIYINGIKVVQQDIICKNGYIHVLEDVMLPAKNMSQIIRDNGETALFNKLLNKFCAPYYSAGLTQAVKNYYNGSTPNTAVLPGVDSVFVKRYFTPAVNTDPASNTLTNYGLLYLDPSDNSYSPIGMQQDMGVMFVPTDQAMNDYINGSKGRYLKDTYGSWENIPTQILALFLKNHQKKSFLNSLPHTWETMTDESSFDMKVSEQDIKKAYVGVNGAVFVTNAVYPPIDYQSVYGSTMISSSTQIMNWAIQNKTMKFYLYLRSMENMYNLIVPVDEAFKNYRDPIAWAKGVSAREIWEFKYMPAKDMVYADVYSVDASGNKGAKIKELTDRAADQTMILNRLNDIVDMHIVVGNKAGNSMTGYIDDGTTNFAMTKSGTTLKIEGQGNGVKMTGGGDIEQAVQPATIVTNAESGQKSRYDSDNGRTYFVDRILQDPTKSVYTVMGEHPEYEAFFNLLKGDEQVFNYFSNDKDITSIFDLKRTEGSSGLGFVVNSFNNFRYTVFIPTQAALDQAFVEDNNLFTWAEIAAELDYDLKKQKTLYLLNFLKYHFMDNSVFISGDPVSGMKYETAARNPAGKFYKLTLYSTGSNLQIETESGDPVKTNVIKSAGLFNLMARDYIVNRADYHTSTGIVASSRSVIHLIDKALRFE